MPASTRDPSRVAGDRHTTKSTGSALSERLPAATPRFLKFACVGAGGVIVNLGVTWIVLNLALAGADDRGIARTLASIAGIVVSIFTNFLINDRWTWKDRDKGQGNWWRRCRDFYVASALAAAVQFAVFLAVVSALKLQTGVAGLSAESVEVLAGQLTGIALATPLNFIVNHVWTFRDRS